MCGRYFLTASGEEIRQQFGCVNSIAWKPRYNIAPSQSVPIMLSRSERTPEPIPTLESARWGLIPAWATDDRIGQKLINARAETLDERPAFRQALKTRRCLIPASGFYEWHRSDRSKQPYAIHREDGRLMAFAGLWERWQHPESRKFLTSCVIITTDANRTLHPLHRRMPVILEEQAGKAWLNPHTDNPQNLLGPCPDTWLRFYPVSTYVNDPRHEDPRCLVPLNQTASLFD